MGAPARPAAVAAIQDDAMQPPAAPTVDQDLETQPLTIAADQAAHEAHNNGMYETITLTPSTMAMSGANDGFEDMARDLPERALFMFQKEHPIRRLCIIVIKNKWFGYSVLFVILLNCVSLGASSNTPAFELTSSGIFLSQVEYFFIAFFTVEMVLKIIGMGFILERGTYMRDPWNIMDFLVVVLGLISLDPKAGNYTAIRAVRVLRPLRTITRVKGMRNLVITLLESLPMLLDVLVLCFFAFFIYGIIGYQMMAGRLQYRCAPVATEDGSAILVPALKDGAMQGTYEEFCSGPSFNETRFNETGFAGIAPPETTSDMEFARAFGVTRGIGHQCSDTEGYDWCRLTTVNPNYGITHFDHFPAALLTIFQCISLEGWTDVMYYAMDAVTPSIWIYFVSLIWFGSFFAVNLALAVLYLRFKQSQEMEAEEAALQRKEDEGNGHSCEGNTADLVPIVNGPNWWRKFKLSCYHLQAHKYFDGLTIGIIIVNTLVMMLERHNQGPVENSIMDTINYVLTGYFAFEMLVKIIGLGPLRYVEDMMNVFDGIVVLVSLIEIAVTASGGNGGSGLSVLRTFRLLRIFKLARSWKELNKIINTIFQSLASIAYLSLILLLIVFIFALLGMQLFGYRYYYCDPYPDSFRLCPTNNTKLFEECPSHFNCYISCNQADAGKWISLKPLGTTSQFFDQALCEERYFLWNETSPQSPDLDLPPRGDNTTDRHYVAMVGESYLARHHFDDIFMSIITIFQILTGENWNSVMYDGMRSTGVLAVAYFVLLVVVGNYIILNLFLAILLDNFSSDDEPEAGNDSFGSLGTPSEIAVAPTSTPLSHSEGHSHSPLLHEAPTSEGAGGEGEDDPTNIIRAGNTNRSLRLRGISHTSTSSMTRPVELKYRSLFIFGPENRLRLMLNSVVSHKYFEYTIILLIILSSITLALDSAKLQDSIEQCEAGKPCGAKTILDVLAQLDLAFVFLFTIEAALKIVVMGFAFHPGSYLRNAWNVLDFFIVIVGLVLWRLSSSGSGAESVESLRALRTFRALRPIRMASRAEGMKIVVNALFQSIPPLGNVVLVCLLFFLIFSILFVNLLKGSFYSCRVICPPGEIGAGGDEFCSGDNWLASNVGLRFDPKTIMPDAYVGNRYLNKTWCLANGDLLSSTSLDKNTTGFHYVGSVPGVNDTYYPYEALSTSTFHEALGQNFTTELLEKSLPKRNGGFVVYHEWINKKVNFDNVINSLITLFEMATLEMWLDVMYDAVDSVDVDQQPIRDNNVFIAIVVVLFLVVCAFFILNLFVGVTIDKFNDMKAKNEGRSLFLTEEQQNWLTIQKLLAATKPMRKFKPPEGGLRRMVYNVVTSDWFDGFIMMIIMINVLFMASEHHGMPLWWAEATTYANYVFTVLFTCEAILKLISMGVIGYFRDAWNAFDFLVVSISIVGIAMELAQTPDVGPVSLLRVFRVARIFRLIPKAKGLRTLFQTLVFSLPALFNVGSVLLLFFFIFSIMGMNLFGGTMRGEFLSRHANFDDFPSSMLVLMRMATGESWNGIMHDCSVASGCHRVNYEVVMDINSDPIEAGSYVDAETARYGCSGCWEPNPEHPLPEQPPGEPEWPGSNTYDPEVPLPSWVFNHYFTGECGQPMAICVVYFFAFVLICSFILLNLVIAVILDNFQSSTANEAMPVSRFHMGRFVDAWADLDSAGTCFIPVSKLSHLISELEPPLGVKGVIHTKSEVQNIIMTVDIPNRAGHVHFLETLHALSGRVAGCQLPEDEELLIHKQMHERLPDTTYPKYSAAHYHAALYVQAAVRGFLARHQMKSRLHSTYKEDST